MVKTKICKLYYDIGKEKTSDRNFNKYYFVTERTSRIMAIST